MMTSMKATPLIKKKKIPFRAPQVKERTCGINISLHIYTRAVSYKDIHESESEKRKRKAGQGGQVTGGHLHE